MDCQVNYHNPMQPEVSSGRGMCKCSLWVIDFFAVLLAFALGLILGAVFVGTILAALPAIIVFAIVMAVLIIALIIYRYCMCCRIRRC